MKTEILLTMLAAVLVKGEPAEAPFSPQCYKKSTDPDSDFSCAWEPDPGIAAGSFSLFYHAQGRPVAVLWSGRGRSCRVTRETVLAKKRTTLWVEAKVGNRTYRSLNLSVVLDTQVKYDAPEIIRMSRSSGNLTLWWARQHEEDKGAIHELAFRKQGGDLWQNKTFETSDGGSAQEEWTGSLPEDECYEVRLRRRAKGLGTVIWSDWSSSMKVPIEIGEKPKATWRVGELKMGVRLLKLTWEEPQTRASFGGVSYKVSVFYGHCWTKNATHRLRSTKHDMNVTAAAVSLNITAVNGVGESPTAQITVPAEHLSTCSKRLDLSSENAKKLCVEWYSLSDGKTPSSSVKTFRSRNMTHAMRKMRKQMEDFVRYHYFVHVGSRSRRTVALCPLYKKEGAPRSAPVNVKVVNKTHSSAVLRWKPIPVSKQRGFLKRYVISIARKNKTDIEKVSWLQTNYTIQNLCAGTEYVVNISGETDAGSGPSATVKIQMLSPPSAKGGIFSKTNKIITWACVFMLCFTLLCSYVFKRFKSKYLPDIPRPVIQETLRWGPEENKEMYPVGERVDALVLVSGGPERGGKKLDVQEERTMLVGGESSSQEPEDDEYRSDSDAADAPGFAPSPDYKGQAVSPRAPLEGSDRGQRHHDDATPSYNSVVFEGRAEDAEGGAEL